ncbi:hypothetical protein N183_32865 [Sinorhizobium sp. Sb3]|uniref:transporter substrate-binding domain-containing protein n=1 Tax=Sinorhizobium sp. Sb3 TaxID=1358417 RepID=UPI00071E129F|nr:transporter substrate-binding domain-containing protein [Sinorhizobium sp. Sb3]KSV66851.1 hypothetical protein N183_32865 [Sinorhizobium sp. Sb3]
MKNIVAAALLLASVSAARADGERDLVLANEGGFPPFNSIAADGNLQGFDIDIGNAICKIIEAKCTFVTNEWSGIIPALEAKKFDVIIGGMGITEERKKHVIFSEPYARYPSRFGVLKGKEFDLSPEALGAKVIGVQQGTTNAKYIETFYIDATVRRYPSTDALISDLKAGRIDAIFGGTEQFKEKSTADAPLVEIGPPIAVSEGIGIAFRPEDTALRDKFNDALRALRDNGTWREYADKWGIPKYN